VQECLVAGQGTQGTAAAPAAKMIVETLAVVGTATVIVGKIRSLK